MPREFARHLRVGAELQRILNELLQRGEIKDPRLQGVRVSEVEVSGDLGVARVFYSTLQPDADAGPVEAAFRRAASFIRMRVGRLAKLRRVPELRFEQDLSAREGLRISRLIDSGLNSRADDTADD